MKRKQGLPVIGWREWVSLPELGIRRIKVKVDTGARSSSLHAYNLEYFRRKKKDYVRFEVHPLQRNSTKVVRTEAQILEHRNVKSSSGRSTYRPVIVTELELFDIKWPIEVTLANRDQMGFRMLLGREAVRRRFVVDPGKSYYAGKPQNPKSKKRSAA